MAAQSQGRSSTTVLLAATVGAVVIVVLNDLALAASGWSVKLFVVLAGVVAGVAARATDRVTAERLRNHIGAVALGVVIVGDVILGALAVGDQRAVAVLHVEGATGHRLAGSRPGDLGVDAASPV